MAPTVLIRDSLKTRITLSTLGIFLAGLWSLAFFASQILREDMERLLGEQQFTIVSMAAGQLNNELEIRRDALENAARLLSQTMQEKPAKVQTSLAAILQEQYSYSTHFNGGITAYRLDGTAIADIPKQAGRVGANHMHIDSIAAALKEGKTTFSRPILTGEATAPEFTIATPLWDDHGRVIGALAGVIKLGRPNPLSQIINNPHGKMGGFLLIAPKSQQVIAATDKNRIMEPTPASGFDPLIDRFIQGHEESGVANSPRGEKELISGKNIPVAGWYMVLALPATVAYTPISYMRWQLTLITFLVTLLAGGLTWSRLKLLLSPLASTARKLAGITDGSQPLQTLPVTKQDEIGQLISGFNALLETLVQREKALQETQATLQAAMDQSPAGIAIADAPDGALRYLNDAGLIIRGETRETVAYGAGIDKFFSNQQMFDLDHRPLAPGEVPLARAVLCGETCGRESIILRPDNTERIIMSKAAPIRNKAGEVVAGISIFLDITGQKKAEDEIKHLAYYDHLTGLPNRRLLIDRLGQALATRSQHQREGAVLFIDLDNFKTLNDTLGHDIGDLLLREVAQRLMACVREGDTVAHPGGDEFVVMLENLSEDATEAASLIESLCEKILFSLTDAYTLAGHEHYSTASIGIALFSDSRDSVEELLKHADMAMYQAKEGGRNTLRFFNPRMQAVVTARVALEADLREALLKKQFLLVYQPQVNAAGQIIGTEALLRWQHPERGLVSPAEFIMLSEETGLILPIGQWVLETACHQLAAWSTQPRMNHLTVAVNISARQLHHENFVQQVLDVLERTGANPHQLKLELTESLLVDNIEDIIAKMTTLKTKGVGFSLDDFGTGYSSLAYLKRLPLDQLKIDKSFVRDILTDPNDAAIARTIVALGQSLGLAVIAEGVETEAQRDSLASNGCLTYQGYFFNRPLPVERFKALLQQPTPITWRNYRLAANMPRAEIQGHPACGTMPEKGKGLSTDITRERHDGTDA